MTPYFAVCRISLLAFVTCVWCLLFACSQKETAGKDNSFVQRTESVLEKPKTSTQSQELPTASSVNNPKFAIQDVLGVWTNDPEGPHADFEITTEYYFVVDYEGEGNTVYTISNDSIYVYFPDFVNKGQITNSTLLDAIPG